MRVVAAVACDRRDINVIKCGQMVEVEDVGLQVIAAEDQVAADTAVVRDLVGKPEGVVEGEC